MDSCCYITRQLPIFISHKVEFAYRDLHALSADKLHGAHDVLFHLHELRELLGEVRAKGTWVDRLAECVACRSGQREQQSVSTCFVPMLALPKIRPPLVEDEGGGGFWICEAVGARDWRMEYVRCMMGCVVVELSG